MSMNRAAPRTMPPLGMLPTKWRWICSLKVEMERCPISLAFKVHKMS
jgi:hypothetical protein